MRTIFSVLIVLLSTYNFANAGSSETSCRDTYFPTGNTSSLALAVENDLLSGLWAVDGASRYSLNAEEAVFEFTEAGMLDVFLTDMEGKIQYDAKFWYVEQFGDAAFLVIENAPNSRDHLFEVQQTCEGAVLTDVSGGETVFLTYIPGGSNFNYDLTRAQLTGEWTHVGYPYEIATSLEDCGTFEQMDGAYLGFTFNEDGTFSRKIGNRAIEIEQEGIWSLSANGRFITLYFGENGNPEQIYKRSVIRIVGIDGQNLQLEQSIETEEYQSFFCTPVKSFTFEKINS